MLEQFTEGAYRIVVAVVPGQEPRDLKLKVAVAAMRRERAATCGNGFRVPPTGSKRASQIKLRVHIRRRRRGGQAEEVDARFTADGSGRGIKSGDESRRSCTLGGG